MLSPPLEFLQVKAKAEFETMTNRFQNFTFPFPFLRYSTEGIDMYVLYFQGLLLSLSPLRSGGCVVPNGGKDVCELKHVVFDRCFRSHIS